jgi:hypothetical protein
MMFNEFNEFDMADEVLKNIEMEYGRSIARIPYFERSDEEHNCFDIKIIFTDFKLLEGQIKVLPFHNIGATVRVSGTYY